MLKRLRIKFIIVIMSVVTVMFASIFGLLMHMTMENIERESEQMMRSMLFRPPGNMQMPKPGNIPNMKPDSKRESIPNNKPENEPPPTEFPNTIRLPYFTLTIDSDGTITASDSDYFDLSDTEFLRELVTAAENSEKQNGVLPEYDLRYMKSDSRHPRLIVFADVSSEKAMLRGLIRNCIIIGLLGYAVFFVISLLLAKWVTKPVEKTWREQKQFIADASHELKTPLTVIMTNAEMMNDGCYTESDRSTFLGNILSTSKRMRGLVESLLQLARLDNNQTQPQYTRLDYSKLINNSILPFEPLFFENDLILETDIEEGISVEGDKDRLRQVVTILLDNALKYCEPSDNVTVSLKKQASNSMFAVSGAGKPLSKEECEKIFKRFYRVDQSRNDGHSYGLGLSIAESIIKEHHGRIWAESENNHNTFYVSLPC